MPVIHRFIANKDYIPMVQKDLQAGHTATFTVRGRSMRIWVEGDRDSALLRSIAPDAVRPMDIVLAEVAPQHYVLHRVIQREGDRLTLMGDGNVAGTEACRTTDVIAVAEGFYRGRKQKFCACSSRRFRAYSWCWVRLRPIRRYLLYIWRKVHGWP